MGGDFYNFFNSYNAFIEKIKFDSLSSSNTVYVKLH